mmetsp:Transcript_18032/g.39114  ORF Transcript_18032/g.39114 Transcript_18032/m.39114 type:complete len:205 (+) Transcript_18032:162-776(+)
MSKLDRRVRRYEAHSSIASSAFMAFARSSGNRTSSSIVSLDIVAGSTTSSGGKEKACDPSVFFAMIAATLGRDGSASLEVASFRCIGSKLVLSMSDIAATTSQTCSFFPFLSPELSACFCIWLRRALSRCRARSFLKASIRRVTFSSALYTYSHFLSRSCFSLLRRSSSSFARFDDSASASSRAFMRLSKSVAALFSWGRMADE